MKSLNVTVCLLMIFCAACSSKKPPSTPPVVDVTVYQVESKNIPAIFDFIGFAESSHPVEIRARVEGYLDKIAYQEGQTVNEGDLLFLLDPNQYQAKVEEAKGEVLRQKALVENAKLTVNRLKPLYEQKAASKKDLDNAIANQLSTEAALQSARANLLNAKINLGYTTIKSPIKGLTDKAKFREGALITPGENGLLTTVSVIDPIWVYFSVSDNDILKATKQSTSQDIVLPAENAYDIEAITSDGKPFAERGRVDFSSPTYDQSTGSLLVRAVFPNPKGDLRPGQFVRIKVYGATRPHALIVPQRALSQNKNGLYVYIINDDNTVHMQDVSVAEWHGEYQIVTNGLKQGDRIVVDGINKIRQGSLVNPIAKWESSTNTKK